jgi:uncharacterized protein (UPF0212 family)
MMLVPVVRTVIVSVYLPGRRSMVIVIVSGQIFDADRNGHAQQQRQG